MNWKTSLTGAVLVIVAGLAVGVAIGGKTTDHVRTTTVAKTITTTATTAQTSSTQAGQTSSTSSDSSSTAASVTSGAGPQYYADYLKNQNIDLNSTAKAASTDGSPTSLNLGGKTYPRALAFHLDNGSPPLASVQLPVAGFKQFSASTAGLATSDSSKASYKLVIYKNNDGPSATVLYSGTFTGPSGTHRISFNTQGATDLVLDWTAAPNNPDNGDQFIFADPVVTS